MRRPTPPDPAAVRRTLSDPAVRWGAGIPLVAGLWFSIAWLDLRPLLVLTAVAAGVFLVRYRRQEQDGADAVEEFLL